MIVRDTSSIVGDYCMTGFEKRPKEEITFVDIYQMSGIDKRIDFIIEHYPHFVRMLDAFEVGLITNIKRERRYNRSAENGDIGVRVQTSGYTDPTGNEGSTNGDLRTYIRQGNFMAALKGTDNFFTYKSQIITLMDMRDDYEVVSAAVESLNDEQPLYVSYLQRERSIAETAEAEGVTEEAIRSRFYRVRKLLIKRTKTFMKNNSKYSLLLKGA